MKIPMGTTVDCSKREGAASLFVLKTGRDRVHSVNCPVCGTKIKLGVPVVSEFIGTGNQALRGGRQAVMKIRHHCETIHPNEYVWWAVPTGGVAVNETTTARMDEFMRYVLDRTAAKLGIHVVRSIASNDAWCLKKKIIALSSFIFKRYMASLAILEYTSHSIFRYKKLAQNTDLATKMQNQASLHLETMAYSLIKQCRQYAEIIFDNTTYDAYINRLQLCYFERGRWRMLDSATSSTASVFGSATLLVQGASGKQT